MNQKIFLTGATSFLGKHVCDALRNGSYDTFLSSNHEDAQNNIKKVDLTNLEEVQRASRSFSPDIIIHAGGLVNLSRDFSIGRECFHVNTLGTMNLLESIKETPPSLFIYISSEEVYGNGPIPFLESQALLPPSPYAISKAAAEYMASWYGKEYNFPVVIVRLGTFYGPIQPVHKYFAQTILRALKNETIPCNSGMKKRDYIYVDDAVNLILRILKQPTTTIINGAGGKSYSLLEVIKIIKKYAESDSKVKIGEIPDRITERDEWIADISKAKEIYGWEPMVGLEEGLKRMVIYFKEQI